jgi:hypothetical protein
MDIKRFSALSGGITGIPGTSQVLEIYLFIYLFIQVYCPYATLSYERPTPHL